MSAVQSTRDLRSSAVDSKRAAEYKSKWNPGWTHGIDMSYEANGNKMRPPHPAPVSIGARRGDRGANAKWVKEKHDLAKLDRLGMDLHEENEALPPLERETENAFDGTPRSYDSTKEPTAGQHLLGLAMNQAVARYEDKQTTKLVKDESVSPSRACVSTDPAIGTTCSTRPMATRRTRASRSRMTLSCSNGRDPAGGVGGRRWCETLGSLFTCEDAHVGCNFEIPRLC